MCAPLSALSPCGPIRVITEAAAADRGDGALLFTTDRAQLPSALANAGDSQERILWGGLCLSQGTCSLPPSLLLLPAPFSSSSSSLPPVLPCLLPAPKQSPRIWAPQDLGELSRGLL